MNDPLAFFTTASDGLSSAGNDVFAIFAAMTLIFIILAALALISKAFNLAQDSDEEKQDD